MVDGLKDKKDVSASLNASFGKKFVRLVKMYFASFGLGFMFLPAAVITNMFSSTKAVTNYANGVRRIRDAAQARLDKLKKKGK